MTIIAYILLSYLVCILIVPRLADYFDHMTEKDDKKKFERILTSLVTVSIGIVMTNPGLVILGADATTLDLAFRLTMTFVVVTASFAIWKIYIYIAENLLYEYEKDDDSVLDTSLLPVFGAVGKIIISVLAVTDVHVRIQSPGSTGECRSDHIGYNDGSEECPGPVLQRNLFAVD